ncbi:MAG: hypothetical protein IJS89_07035 [Bacteroidaceae bacterium]|nr:hypothetical protein [Bacteroidaceae bacterium]
MKFLHILFVALAATLAFSCQPKSKSEKEAADATIDSLRRALADSKSESGDLMSTVDAIQEGFRMISEAEGQVSELRAEGAVANRDSILAKMASLQQRLQQNRDLIANLQEQLRNSTQTNEATRRTFENMVAQFQRQLEEKQQTIEALQRTIQQRDATIAQQQGQISDLNTTTQRQQSQISDLEASSSRQNQQIQQQRQALDESQRTTAAQQQQLAQQEAQMNTAYYVFGTKKELKAQNILSGGDVLRSGFNRDYFTKIDIRNTRVINLYSKKAELLTNHPAGSYTLEKNPQKQYVLRINNPQAFWSTSKYLVILVK